MTPGVFYASLQVATAVAEMAFARLRIFAESPGTPWPANAVEHTAFAVRFRTAAAIDLTLPAFEPGAEHWTHPIDYAACQALAETAREARATRQSEVLFYHLGRCVATSEAACGSDCLS